MKTHFVATAGILSVLVVGTLLVRKPEAPSSEGPRRTTAAKQGGHAVGTDHSASRERRSIARQRETDHAGDLLAQLLRISDPGERAEFVSRTLRRLTEKDTQELMAFAAGLPEGPLRTPTLLQALQAFASAGHAEEALRQVPQLLPAEEQAAACLSIAAGWAEDAPQAAIQWCSNLTDEMEKNTAVQIIAGKWGESDPAAALAWLDEQTDLTVWNEAMIAISASWAEREPARALAWARLQVAAEPEFRDPLHTILRQWSEEDPEAACLEFAAETADDRREVASIMAANYARSDVSRAMEWAERLADPEVRELAVTAIDEVRNEDAGTGLP